MFETRKKTFYFPDKDQATEFKTALKKCRLIGTPSLRKTLASRCYGATKYTDRRHVDGYSVAVRAWSFADEIEIAKLVKQFNSLTAPMATS